MKYVIVLILLLPNLSSAQSNVSGLGPYKIGITSPDSLAIIDFEEEGPSYVKGTLTLPCTHIRLFNSKSFTMKTAGLVITNLWLAFYDNKLFKISCDYSASLKEAFLIKYGKGVPRPTSNFLFCIDRKDKPMVVWGEIWQNADILARVIQTKGYNAECELEEADQLIIASQRFSALSSDCELKNTNPIVEEFDKGLNEHQQPQKQQPVKKIKE